MLVMLVEAKMKIIDVQVIRFSVESDQYRTKWGYGKLGPKKQVPNGLIKIITNEGYNGFDTSYGWGSYYDPPS